MGPQSRLGFGVEGIEKSLSEKWNTVIYPTTKFVISGSLSAYSFVINNIYLIVKETNKKRRHRVDG